MCKKKIYHGWRRFKCSVHIFSQFHFFISLFRMLCVFRLLLFFAHHFSGSFSIYTFYSIEYDVKASIVNEYFLFHVSCMMYETIYTYWVVLGCTLLGLFLTCIWMLTKLSAIQKCPSCSKSKSQKKMYSLFHSVFFHFSCHFNLKRLEYWSLM